MTEMELLLWCEGLLLEGCKGCEAHSACHSSHDCMHNSADKCLWLMICWGSLGDASDRIHDWPQKIWHMLFGRGEDARLSVCCVLCSCYSPCARAASVLLYFLLWLSMRIDWSPDKQLSNEVNLNWRTTGGHTSPFVSPLAPSSSSGIFI